METSERNVRKDATNHHIESVSLNHSTSIMRLSSIKLHVLNNDTSTISPRIVLSQKKRTNAVHFFEPLVSEVRCIPRTEGKNKGKLFYTKEEYSIFREEYIQHKEDQQGKLTTWLYLAYTYAADLLAALDEADKETGSANNPDKCSDASSQDFISRNDLAQVDVYI